VYALKGKKNGWTGKLGEGVLVLVVCLSLAGCGGGTGRGTPTPEFDLPAGSPVPGVPPAAETPVPSGNLTLQILAPQDGDSVNTKEIQVRGMTAAGAVVSVNDNVLIAGADGSFETQVTLEEGPNLIEVIASDEAGNETSLDLAVTYEP
jgi:hypothetical protein